MTEQEFQKLVLEKLTNLEGWVYNLNEKVSSLDSRVWKLEKWQAKLEKWQAKLEKWQAKLEYIINELREDFVNFKNETNSNFDYTHKLINQAFQKISDNFEFQDKVDAMSSLPSFLSKRSHFIRK